jgi:uncharacterized phiE125 gp8 family phage protein
MYKIITQPTTEPVTLAEVKMALKSDSTDFADNLTSTQSVAPGSHNIAASLLGTGVDILGYSALVLLESGTNGEGGKVDVKIQESDDNITYTDWTGGAFTQVTTTNDNATYEKPYTGTKQYIRVACTVAVAACEFGVSILTSANTFAEDTWLQSCIVAAREYGESITRRAFATQTLELLLDYFPTEIELPMPPLQSVTSIKYKDSTATETTLAETEYIADTDSNIGKIVLAYGKTWPIFTAYPLNPIRVRFVAGYTTDFPKIFKNAMLLHVGLMNKYRDAGIPEEDLQRVKNIYNMHKAGWF